MLACAVLVNDLRKEFFTGTALAGHQYRQVDRSHLDGALYGGHQCRRIAYDAEAGFGLPDFLVGF